MDFKCELCEDTGKADCPTCTGTGEGCVDGTFCRTCRGNGEVKCSCIAWDDYYDTEAA
jgi:hypothetical protein